MQLTRCFSAVAELLVFIGPKRHERLTLIVFFLHQNGTRGSYGDTQLYTSSS